MEVSLLSRKFTWARTQGELILLTDLRTISPAHWHSPLPSVSSSSLYQPQVPQKRTYMNLYIYHCHLEYFYNIVCQELQSSYHFYPTSIFWTALTIQMIHCFCIFQCENLIILDKSAINLFYHCSKLHYPQTKRELATPPATFQSRVSLWE